MMFGVKPNPYNTVTYLMQMGAMVTSLCFAIHNLIDALGSCSVLGGIVAGGTKQSLCAK